MRKVRRTCWSAIDGSEEYVDNYVDGQIGVTTDGLFDKTDSYLLDSSSDVITVLGAIRMPRFTA